MHHNVISMLDDLEHIKRIDKDGMLDIYRNYIHHFEEAKKLTEKALEDIPELPSFENDDIRNIVVVGMGGSAISGDILRTIYAKEAKFPIIVNRSYSVPGFVDEHSLVLVMSYSGNTAETLSSYEEAMKKGAHIITISSGGKLEELGTANGHPHITIPSGIQPRCALPYLLVPAIVLLNAMGQAPPIEFDFLPTLGEYIQVFFPESLEENNVAKQMAGLLQGKLIFLYGPVSVEPSLRRFATQINENAETHAFWNVFPELCHNEIVAWSNSALENEKFIVLFRDKTQESSGLRRQIDHSQRLVLEEEATVLEIELREENPVLNLLFSIILGDLVSIYMAILREIDPSPVSIIQKLKEEMKKD